MIPLPLPVNSVWFDVSYQMLSEPFPNLALRTFKNYRFLDLPWIVGFRSGVGPRSHFLF